MKIRIFGKMSFCTWKTTFLVLGVLLVQKEGKQLVRAQEAENPKCCELGRSWAEEGLKCDKFTGPVSGIAQQSQQMCLKTVGLCCAKGHRKRACDEGKADARSASGCAAIKKDAPNDHRRDCCKGCELGIKSSGTSGCKAPRFSDDSMNSAFAECCEEIKSTGFRTVTTARSRSTPELTTLSSEEQAMIFGDEIAVTSDGFTSGFNNLCNILKGMLCSHVCIPTRESYYCECPEGHALLEDNKTCRSNAPMDRCNSTENPCDQRCEDSKKGLVCSCEPGYKLAKDKRTCEVETTERHVRMSTDPLLKCPFGYMYNATSEKCDDIDECTEDKNTCGEEVCYNQPGGYICAEAPLPSTVDGSKPKCGSGFKTSKSGECADIDECFENLDTCSSTEICKNTAGSYVCHCKVGFQRENLTQACVDINECQIGTNECLPTQRCDNTVGSYACVRFLPCGTGYTLNAATEICEDDDECALGTHDCNTGYYCKNTLGSYRCYRNPRENGTTAVPKTSTTPKPTTKMTTPKPTTKMTTPKPTTKMTTPKPTTKMTTPKPTTKMTTPKPTTKMTTLKTTTQTTKKVTTPKIVVTLKTTSKIPETTKLTTALTTELTTAAVLPRSGSVECPRGFDVGRSGQCIDINECHRMSRPCPKDTTCVNSIGSYRCDFTTRITCGNGYVYSQARSRCVDVDECAERIHECGSQQSCENIPGGYICSCPIGHTIEGKNCEDVNECRVYQGRICGTNSECENTVGSYRCNCHSGFGHESGMEVCRDINECERSPNLCEHSCINVWGSYTCACEPGFRLNSDNRTCADIDECAEFKDNNLCIGICENTPGSYRCTCPQGYRLGMDGRTCQDIDECTGRQVCVNPQEICQNTRGSYRCNKINCPLGYYQDKDRKNRCIRANKYCQIDDTNCIHSPSHYSYNFITFVSMMPIPRTGRVELFTMRGTYLPSSSVQFSMNFIEAQAPLGVVKATKSCFSLNRSSASQAVLLLVESLHGPQKIELELTMEIYNREMFAGKAVAKISILVSQYEF